MNSKSTTQIVQPKSNEYKKVTKVNNPSKKYTSVQQCYMCGTTKAIIDGRCLQCWCF